MNKLLALVVITSLSPNKTNSQSSQQEQSQLYQMLREARITLRQIIRPILELCPVYPNQGAQICY